MLITAPMSFRAAPRSLVWKPAAPDLYVATLDGEFAGYVSAVADLHTTFGPHAQNIGSHGSFRAASAALGHWLALAGPTGVPPDLSRLALPAGLSR